MRIISGQYKHRLITPPSNCKARPTTDLAKESLFNILENSIDFESVKVLDLFGGTGQLGIEALSRGAVFATFVDSSKESCAIVRENIAATGFQRKCHVINADAIRFAATARERYDIVFADPPYLTEDAAAVLEVVGRILLEDGLLLLETDDDTDLPETAEGLELVKKYRYSRTAVRLYRKAGE